MMKGENNLFELLVVLLFCWLSFKAVGLAISLTWGAAKILASLLFAIAVPVLFICLLFAGGIVLLLPLVLVGGAVGLLKVCA